MREFLDSLTSWIVFTGLVEVEGKEYCYHVVRQDFKPDLPNFAGIDQEVLFVSDSVPEQDRQYIFWHEVVCVIHRQRRGCVQTLMEELQRVPEKRHEYIERRCKFFEALVAFYAKRPPKFYHEIVASYQHLMSLLEG